MCAPSALKWLSHSPFISKASGSIFSRGLLSRQTKSSCEKSTGQRSAKSCGFSTLVSFHRESCQGGLGKTGSQ